MAIETVEQARQVNELMQRLPDNDPRKAQAAEALRTFMATQQQAPVEQEPLSAGQRALGALDIAAVTASGMLGEIAGGLRSIATLATDTVKGQPNALAAKNTGQATREFIALEPRTEGAKRAFAALAPAAMAVEEYIDRISVENSGGSPFAAAAIKTTILGVPEFLGGVAAGGRSAGRSAVSQANKQAIAAVKAAEQKLGINISPRTIRADTVSAIKSAAGERGDLGEAQIALQQADKAAKAQVDRAFEAARQSPASLQSGRVDDFRTEVIRDLADNGYGIDAMPKVQSALARLQRLGTETPEVQSIRTRVDQLRRQVDEADIRAQSATDAGEAGRARTLQAQARDNRFLADQLEARAEGLRPETVDLDEFMKLRKQLTRRSTDPAENGALAAMKHKLDRYLDSEFNNDMISGTPEALERWKDANATSAVYFKQFKDDKVLRDMIAKETTPEQIKNWLLGASQVGGKAESGLVARRLTEVLGKEHGALQAIRGELLLDALEPAFAGRQLNFGRMTDNIQNLLTKHRTVLKELDVDTKTLGEIAQFTRVADQVQDASSVFFDRMPDWVAKLTVGNQLAKATLRQQGLAGFIRAIGFQGVNKDTIRKAVAGSDFVDRPVLPSQGPAAGAIIAGAFLHEIGVNAEQETSRKR